VLQKFLLAVFILFAFVIGWMAYNACSLNSMQTAAPPDPQDSVNNGCCAHLSKLVQFRTTSFDRIENADSATWKSFISFIDTAYPLINRQLEKHIINHYSLLYIWHGEDSLLKPVLLISHTDVMPVDKNDEGEWKFDPFSGTIAHDTIYGKGTMENKMAMVAMLEAAEKLLSEKFHLQRTIILAFGSDEEYGGQLGASQISAYLQLHHLQPEYILDEGGTSTVGIIPGILKPVALVGTAEKGFASVSLSVNTNSNVSSSADNASAISILSKAVSNVTSHQPAAHISDPVHAFIRYLAPEMPFHMRFIFANSWLFHSIILHQFEETNAGNAMVRTTATPTNFESGTTDHSDPPYAEAVIHFSILPGETAQSVLQHTREAVHDNRVKVSLYGLTCNPSPVSPTNSFGFKTIEATIRELDPDAIVAPYLVLSETDSHNYESICPLIYHYVPVMQKESGMQGIEDANEKVSISRLKNAVCFYYQLLKNSNQKF
jgi:carboxypeptidase PM20D1